MGYCSPRADRKAFDAGFEQTVSRGPDDCRVKDTGEGLLGFRRLAIMGLTPEGMQPFELNGCSIVCNGEIYGFESGAINSPATTPSKALRTARCCCDVF